MFPQSSGETLSWQRVGGWFGGTVSALAVSPRFATDRLVLAATLAGIYCSTDGGRQWRPLLQGLSDLTTLSLLLTLDKDDRLTAFATTQHGRLYCFKDVGQITNLSHDTGDAWQEITSWAGLGVINTLLASPAYPEDGTLFAATAEGVFRSLDRGQNWQSASFGLLDPEVLCLACAPDFARNETLWAGTAAGGFYRSRNAGRAWRESGFGLPDCAILCLALAPDFSESQIMFAGTEGAGIYCSTDAGASWFLAGAELAGETINCLALSPDYGQDQNLLAGTSMGIFLSTDGGTGWQPVLSGQTGPLALAYTGKSSILAGNYGTGVALSEDGGRHWQPVNTGLAAHVPPLAVLDPQAELVAAAIDTGVAASWDGGATWQEQPSGLASLETQLLVANKGGIFVAAGAQLYRAETLSQSWSPLNLPLAEEETPITLLALSPDFERWPYLLAGTAAGQLYLSVEGGEHWQALPAPPVAHGGMLSAAFGQTVEGALSLYLITATEVESEGYRVELWRQAPLHAPWEMLISVEPVKIPIAMLAIPHAQSSLFLAVQNQIIRLAGQPQLEATQFVLGEALNITALLSFPTDGTGYGLGVATNRGVFYSGDEGETWQRLGRGLEDRAVVALLPPTPGVQSSLGAVTLGGEVWWLEEVGDG